MHSTIKIARNSFVVASATALLVAGSAWASGADLGFEASEPGDLVSFEGAPHVFYVASEIDASQVQLVTVSNPSGKDSIVVQLRAITEQAEARVLAAQLAPLDEVSFDLQAGAVRVLATSEAPFHLDLFDDSGVQRLPMEKARTGRNPRTNGAAVEGHGKGLGPDSRTVCDDDWTLTCDSGGCSGLGPFTHAGRVEQELIYIGGIPIPVLSSVYWNLNTPTGNYTTKAPGPLTATWYTSGGNCPTSVTNSLGHTYTVTR